MKELILKNEYAGKSEPVFYDELVSRNRHFITSGAQKRLKELRVFVAGCGAAGGACIEPLVRLGVTHLRLADNGAYELTNLNRQHTFVDHLGENKATFHAMEALRINPFADILAIPEGVSLENLPSLITWADVIIDAVDVTVQESIQLKFKLHEIARESRKPVLAPLDPGYCQMGRVFDYRNPACLPIHGKLEKCQTTKNPIHGLLAMFPIETFPNHSLQLMLDLLERPEMHASQLGCSADLLSGVIASVFIGFATSGLLPYGWRIDLAPYALTLRDRISLWYRGFFMRRRIRALLAVK